MFINEFEISTLGVAAGNDGNILSRVTSSSPSTRLGASCPATIKNGTRRQLKLTPGDNYKLGAIFWRILVISHDGKMSRFVGPLKNFSFLLETDKHLPR